MANHELYVVQGKTLDNIAGTMRAVLGVDKDAPIRFDEVASSDKTEQINADVETQTDLIAQIKKALEGKASVSAAEIMALIDESGVLDSTDGTATEKVEQLIDKSNEQNLWYAWSENYAVANVVPQIFNGYKGTQLPKFNFSKCTNTSRFLYQVANVKTIDFYINCENSTNGNAMFYGTTALTKMKGFNSSKMTNIAQCFMNSGIEEIEQPFDLSFVTNNSQAFSRADKLKEIRFDKETIKISITIPSSVLSIGNVFNLNDTENVGSVQSIINGLATLAEGAAAQTLTLSKNLPLTEEQKQAITTAVNNKGWTLAFA